MSEKNKKHRPESENRACPDEGFYGFSRSCEDAMFFNPVASATDSTGYTSMSPRTEDEAEEKARLLNIPVEEQSEEHTKKQY